MERTKDTNGITKGSNWKERFITTSRFRERERERERERALSSKAP